MTFDNQFVRDLVAMRRAGIFQAIWIDADRIRVQREMWEDPHRIMREEAQRLIDEWKGVPRKPAEPERAPRRLRVSSGIARRAFLAAGRGVH
jgi:hypothetical protein